MSEEGSDVGCGKAFVAILAAAACGLCSQPATAAKIYSVDLGSGTVAIAIDGDISNGDGEVFRREAAKHTSAIVLLESDGGSTLDAIDIGEAIRLRGFSTLVINGSTCASACGLIWLAGTPRALSKSARVGFHATYTDQAGKHLESGVGNALVGRYFALLNLPTKAIIFATEAAPDDVNWLDQTNYLDAGIDVRFVDDWTDDKATGPSRDSSPPPITIQSSKPSASTETWKMFDQWTVMVDHTLSDSCFAASQFTDGSILRIGVNREGTSKNYLILANTAWSSLAVGDEHPMSFQFDDETPWNAKATVINLNGVKALAITFSDSEFWVEFALSKSLHVTTGSRRVATLNLDRSRQALDALLDCQTFYDKQRGSRDPFAP